MQDYILVPHFYRLNWAKEMSTFLAGAGNFQFNGKLEFGNYKKATILRNAYLDSLVNKPELECEQKKKNLFFVNLNDFIFYERMQDLKNEYNIYGFMRGSRFFDSEPGNNSIGTNLFDLQKKETDGLALVDGLFLGSKAFLNFLLEKNPSISKIKTKVVGVPIFIKPSFLDKAESIKRNNQTYKEKKLIIWNHRLQKQKNPWMVFLLGEDIRKNIAVCTPEALSAAYSKEMKLNEKIFKYIVRDNGGRRRNYLEVLKKSEYVLSTSEHETWGNSVIEAVMEGAVPILPNGEKCSYKELFPQQFLYPQEWLNKKTSAIKKKNHADLLTQHIRKCMLEENYKLVESVQTDLYHKYYCDYWVKNLHFV